MRNSDHNDHKYQYQVSHRYFAQTQRLLEPIARDELEELGAQRCAEAYCGVYFEADPVVLYNIIYCVRTVNRVLAPLVSFPCPSEKVLYKHAYDFPWHGFFGLKKTFAVTANVANSRINHSHFAALRVKDAIVDRFRRELGKRPDVNPSEPDLLFNLNINENKAVISLDVSGVSLHRRGYRKESVAAPLQESLAAAIIRISGWAGEKPLLDPMCGSGTFLAEALMKYSNIPAGFKRDSFGLFHLPDFDRSSWKNIKFACDKNMRVCPNGLISGSDIDPIAVKAATDNLKNLPHSSQISILQRDFRDIPNAEGHTIIINPPYGFRLAPGDEEELQALYRHIGDFLKKKCTGSTAYILCGEKELTKHIGLKISRRIPLYNGPIEARLVKIELY